MGTKNMDFSQQAYEGSKGTLPMHLLLPQKHKCSSFPPSSVLLSHSAHLSLLRQKRAFLQFQLLGRTYKTEIAKSKAGELLFTQQMSIEKTD
jgi:hypothetical protein